MTKKSKEGVQDIALQIDKLAKAQRKHTMHLKLQNRLARAQIDQDNLRFEQTERLYLLEKSKLQPSFKLNVTEFLLCEADFMNDPEQAGEAKFLKDSGINIDERVIRFQVNLEEKGQYLRPRLIIDRDNIESENTVRESTVNEGSNKHYAEDNNSSSEHDLAISMHDRLYFLPFNQLSKNSQHSAFDVYWVYQDQTSLPVIHKYLITQQKDSSLMRWNAVHVDTVFGLTKQMSESFNSAEGCKLLFSNRF